jgi:hypothetical protein
LGGWRPDLEAAADRIPCTKVDAGESLVDDRRFVSGSAVQLGERIAEDETADDRLKI